MNELIAQNSMSDEIMLETLLTKLKNIQPFTDSYREDARDLFNAMHALPSHLTITNAQRKEIEQHFSRASMRVEFTLEGYQSESHEIWKISYNEPIRLKGNTDTIKLRLSHEFFEYEDYSPIKLHNEYGEELTTSTTFNQKVASITASEPFVKGRPYYAVVRDELLAKKGSNLDSIGRNVIITFIVD